MDWQFFVTALADPCRHRQRSKPRIQGAMGKSLPCANSDEDIPAGAGKSRNDLYRRSILRFIFKVVSSWNSFNDF